MRSGPGRACQCPLPSWRPRFALIGNHRARTESYIDFPDLIRVMALTLYILAVGIPIVIGAFWLTAKQLEAEKAKKTCDEKRQA